MATTRRLLSMYLYLDSDGSFFRGDIRNLVTITDGNRSVQDQEEQEITRDNLDTGELAQVDAVVTALTGALGRLDPL